MYKLKDVVSCILHGAFIKDVDLDYSKLEALTYYCQAHSFGIFKEPLFKNQIEINDNDITIPDLKKNSAHLTKICKIVNNCGFPNKPLTEQQRSIFTNLIKNEYKLPNFYRSIIWSAVKYLGKLNNKTLRDKIKQEAPYLKAKQNEHKVISSEDMRGYYSALMSQRL